MHIWNFLARRYVIGETREQAIRRARELNHEGVGVLLNALGEDVKTPIQVDAAVQEYFSLIDDVANLDVEISLKLTHFGLLFDRDFCTRQVRRVLEYAKKKKVFVWFDAEKADTIPAMMRIAHSFKQFPLGVAVQCYRRDADLLLKNISLKVRLVKGAYKESTHIIFSRKKDTDEMYRKLMKKLIAQNMAVVIATHDELLIKEAKTLSKGRKNIEFAMLLGVRSSLQRKLLCEGYKVRVYAPYGKDVLAYYLRRLAERRENLFFVLKNIFK